VRGLIWSVALSACVEEEPGASPEYAGASDDGAVAYVLDFGAAPAVGPVAPTVSLSGEDGGPLLGAALAVEAYMPEHGHGPADPPVVSERGDGVYDASWTFPMAGTWDVTLTVDGTHAWVAHVVVE
jgi:hypothetical protein